MSRAEQSAGPRAPTTSEPVCQVEVSDGEPCGRPIHHAPHYVAESQHNDPFPVCLMHSKDRNKDVTQFRQEIEGILAGTSAYHPLKGLLDFTGFIFPQVTFERIRFAVDVFFSRATFRGEADFSHSTFSKAAYFWEATFTQRASFFHTTFNGVADFYDATFNQVTSFTGAIFNQVASFPRAIFKGDAFFRNTTFNKDTFFFEATCEKRAYFDGTVFGLMAKTKVPVTAAALNQSFAVADFTGVLFQQPTLVGFYQVNKFSHQGLRIRFANCRIEGAQFEDLNWHRIDGRIVLQDELDITRPLESEERQAVGINHELVAITYRTISKRCAPTIWPKIARLARWR